MQIHSVVFALRRQINKQKVCKNNLLGAGNKVLQNIKLKGSPNPKLPLAHTVAEYKLSALQASISD